MADEHGELLDIDADALFSLCYMPRGIERLGCLGAEVEVPAGHVFNELGEVPGHCYIVLEGRVICYDVDEAGVQRTFSVFEPGSMFLEECALFDKPTTVTFKATRPTRLLEITKCELKHAFKTDIDIVLDFCEYLSNKFLASMELTRISKHKSVEWRVAKLFQVFAEHYGRPYDGKILIEEHVTQQMIANMLGTNRVSVSRAFKTMKASFLEQINGRYCIRSMEQLEAYMDTVA